MTTAQLDPTASSSTPRTGTLVAVFAAVCLALTGLTIVPAQAADTGTITGKITDASGQPLGGASVTFRYGESDGARGATTKPDGTYDSGPIDVGEVRVQVVHTPSYNQSDVRDYVSEYWSTSTSPARTYAAATPVEVTAGATHQNIDVALDVAPRVRLTVKDAAGNPVPNAGIGIYTLKNGTWGPDDTGQGGPIRADGAGVYRRNVTVGQSHKFYASPPLGTPGVTEWYGGTYSEATATAVTATQYGQLIEITIQFDGARAAAGRFKPTKVSIRGTAKVGKKLRASTRAWAPAPVKLSYTWYRNGKAIKGQKKATYKLRNADKGKRITVRVHQRKAGYATASRLSAKTPKVKKR